MLERNSTPFFHELIFGSTEIINHMSSIPGGLRRKTVLSLYRSLLKIGSEWPRWADTPQNNSLGNYIIQTTMEKFRNYQLEQDSEKITEQIVYAQQELQSLRRLLNENSKKQVSSIIFNTIADNDDIKWPLIRDYKKT